MTLPILVVCNFGSMVVRTSSTGNDDRCRDIDMVPLAFNSENFTLTIPFKSFALVDCIFGGIPYVC